MDDREIKIPPRAGKVKCAAGTMDQPGRNHPGLGAWLYENICRPANQEGYIVDPMCGAGFLWSTMKNGPSVIGCDIDVSRVRLARDNGLLAVQARAEDWDPGDRHACMVAFSPIYPNCGHDSGNVTSDIVERKKLGASQKIEGTTGLLRVFLQIATYCYRAPVCVIVRNWIEAGEEFDWVSEVEQSMHFTGFEVERFWRRLLPGPFTQMKLRSGKQTKWVDREFVLVGRRRND
jgi:hypothetical protein